MKKLLLLLTAFCLLTTSFAAFEIKHVSKKATEIFLPVGNDKKISLMDLSTISVKDYENLTGRHLKFFDKLALKGAQKKLRHSINSDGTINNKMLLRFTNGDGDHSTGFHVGGFALGFFLSVIGLLIAYISGGDEDIRKNRVKWAWYGVGLNAIILGAILRAIVG